MAKKGFDISVSAVSTPTSNGAITYYSIDVINLDNGLPVSGATLNTTNFEKAEKHFYDLKNTYKGATVDGDPDKDPFKSKEFRDQGDYEFGGFGAAECEDEIREHKYGPDETFEDADCEREGPAYGPELNDFDPETAGTKKNGQAVRKKRPTAQNVNPALRCEGLAKTIPKGSDMSRYEKCRQKKWIFTPIQAKINRPVRDDEGIVETPGGFRGKDDSNAFIIIGRDRVDHLGTGWGGRGHTRSDAIDIVAGMGGHTPKEVEAKANGTEEKKDTHPHFFKDAARIYISQKTDVDKNFKIGKFADKEKRPTDPKDNGMYGAKSAIALKADNIRVIGRESIRIVTGTDKKNSAGGTAGKSGIELIAGNNRKTLQPLVLGDNLKLALLTILENVEAFTKIMHGFIKYQMKFNDALQQHTHLSPFYAITTLKSEPAVLQGIQLDVETAAKTEISILKHITNLQGVKTNFLIESGDAFINSELNKVN